MQLGKFGRPSTHPRGLRWQNHIFMNVCILNNSHARQKWNEKKAFDWVKNEAKCKWDEFQTQAQQMQEVWQPLLVWLTFNMLGIIMAWG
jgi:hypothetical protein